MAEDWEIEMECRQEAIDRAVNVILGMSLVSPVTIGVELDEDWDVGWHVSIEDAAGAAMETIPCEDREDANRLADDVLRAVRDEIARLPPFSGRRGIRRRAAAQP